MFKYCKSFTLLINMGCLFSMFENDDKCEYCNESIILDIDFYKDNKGIIYCFCCETCKVLFIQNYLR